MVNFKQVAVVVFCSLCVSCVVGCATQAAESNSESHRVIHGSMIMRDLPEQEVLDYMDKYAKHYDGGKLVVIDMNHDVAGVYEDYDKVYGHFSVDVNLSENDHHIVTTIEHLEMYGIALPKDMQMCLYDHGFDETIPVVLDRYNI